MKTMAQYIIEVDCQKYKVKTLKGSSVTIKKTANLEATNGIVYFIDEPLQIEETKMRHKIKKGYTLNGV